MSTRGNPLINKRRFNSYSRPYSIEHLNAFFRKKGYFDVKLIRNDDGLNFEITEDSLMPIDIRLRDLTFGQWGEELEYALQEEKKKEK